MKRMTAAAAEWSLFQPQTCLLQSSVFITRIFADEECLNLTASRLKTILSLLKLINTQMKH